MPPHTKVEGKVSVGCPPPSSSTSGEEWKSFQFHIHNFATLSTTKDHYIVSPEFICNGRLWQLKLYPGGDNQATEGNVSAYLKHLSEGSITTRYEMRILDKFGNTKNVKKTNYCFDSRDTNKFSSYGWKNFISRSDILDEAQNILDSDGTLTVVVSMEEEPAPAFVPKNPLVKMITEMFNDETTADVCFEVVNSTDEKKGKKKSKSLASFHAHRSILKKCAPMLADLFGSNNSGGIATVFITDVKPDIFRHLLFYLYGGKVPEEDLKTHAKDIMDAADKYSIINLKLEAEAAYVEATKITLDNAIDNLLYADTRNCALLKEAVMDFLAANPDKTAEKVSFVNFPGHLARDIFVAIGRSKGGTKDDNFTTMCVSELRKKLDEKGLDVGGSREAMIESIKSNS